MLHCGDDETGQNVVYCMDLNNRRTGKDATKARVLGLLGHSGGILLNIVVVHVNREYIKTTFSLALGVFLNSSSR